MAEIAEINDVVSLRVSPEVLVAKAEMVLNEVIVLKETLERLEQKVDGTSSYWNGEAGEQYRQIYNEQRENIKSIMNRLQNNPIRLKEIGKNYIDIDKEVGQVTEELLGNVII